MAAAHEELLEAERDGDCGQDLVGGWKINILRTL